ncbi:MAG: energy transducer TonB [Myxococcales bacterium]|nr:energy transducer TonB [Myxococcales bacterium]
MAIRSSMSVVGALGITLGLFFGMRGLISGTEALLEKAPPRRSIEFGRVRKDTNAKQRQRELPKREPPKPPPEAPKADPLDSSGPGDIGVALVGTQIDVGVDMVDISMTAGPANNEAVPIVRIEPIYPRRAADQFIEGWVQLKFDITPTGATANVKVVAAQPKRIFDRAAVQAVSKWKYKPKVVEGQAMVQRGLLVRLDFKLD